MAGGNFNTCIRVIPLFTPRTYNQFVFGSCDMDVFRDFDFGMNAPSFSALTSVLVQNSALDGFSSFSGQRRSAYIGCSPNTKAVVNVMAKRPQLNKKVFPA